MLLGELGDVYEALDAGRDTDERTEGHKLRDLTLDDLAGLVLALELLPRVFLGGLQRQRDALPLKVHVEDLDLDLLADLDYLARVIHVLPRQLRDMHEAIYSAQVNERPEVHDGGHGALSPLPLLEGLQELLAPLALRLLQERSARQHDVVAVPVELDNLGLDLLAHVRMQVPDPTEVDQ